ncbi:MAG TPA: hypothetical protein VHG08_22540 [Longimicrobium sp.]|nr:hypothetical protein [Longimicrobium sp.]
MKISETPRDDTIQRLREAVRGVAENTSLRKVARDIGMSPSGLKKFLEGAAPYSPTRRRLHRWYVQHSGVQHGQVEFPEANAALHVLVHDLTPDSRRRTASRMIECLRLGYRESGKAAPKWVSELRETNGNHLPAGEAEASRPSAMGKYAHLSWSSEEYARSKQDEIELEDGRAG